MALSENLNIFSTGQRTMWKKHGLVCKSFVRKILQERLIVPFKSLKTFNGNNS